jgi:cysteine-rich repeat protein
MDDSSTWDTVFGVPLPANKKVCGSVCTTIPVSCASNLQGSSNSLLTYFALYGADAVCQQMPMRSPPGFNDPVDVSLFDLTDDPQTCYKLAVCGSGQYSPADEQCNDGNLLDHDGTFI